MTLSFPGSGRLLPTLILAAALLPAAGCVSPHNQGVGLVRTSVRGPLWTSHDPLPADAVTGMTEVFTFLGLFSHGDGTLRTAMANGGIARLHHADYEYESLLGLLVVYRVFAVGAPLDVGAAALRTGDGSPAPEGSAAGGVAADGPEQEPAP